MKSTKTNADQWPFIKVKGSVRTMLGCDDVRQLLTIPLHFGKEKKGKKSESRLSELPIIRTEMVSPKRFG